MEKRRALAVCGGVCIAVATAVLLSSAWGTTEESSHRRGKVEFSAVKKGCSEAGEVGFQFEDTSQVFLERLRHYIQPGAAECLIPGDRHAIPAGVYKYGEDPSSNTSVHTTNFSEGLGIGLWHFDLSDERPKSGPGPFRRNYIHPIQELYKGSTVRKSPTDTPFVSVVIGDNFLPLYRRTLVKSRVLGDARGVLLPLNYDRHWGGVWEAMADDTPFEMKKDRVVWRGVTTGYPGHRGNRFDFIKWCFDNPASYLDAAFSRVVQGKESWENYTAGSMTLKEMMTYKFIVCLEGNDISTSLKWALLSQSVVLMPPPTIVSWLMEDRLVPWVHYIPLQHDFTDLHRRYTWAMAHPTRCRDISRRASRYMEQFKSKEQEGRLMEAVLRFYVRYDAAPGAGPSNRGTRQLDGPAEYTRAHEGVQS